MTKRNHLKRTLLIGLLFVLLVGCGADEGVEPTVPPVAAGQESAVPNQAGADRNEAMAGDTPTPLPPDSGEQTMIPATVEGHGEMGETGTDDSQAQVAVTPVVVDLGKITPVPAEEGGEPVEMPQPGVPDPAKIMTNNAVLDLARRLHIDSSEISLLSIDEVQWRDSSLGCPKPNMNYLMVITPGYRIILEANGETYEYHSDRNQRVVFCPADRAKQQPEAPEQ